MKIYLSGPMRGVPKFNFPLFDAAAADLRAQGHAVWSPADHDREVWPEIEREHPGFAEGVEVNDSGAPYSFTELIKADIVAVTESDAIALLPGWEQSSGAAIERRVAEDCNIPVYLAVQEAGVWCLAVERKPLVVGVSGWAQHGKDTIGQILAGYGFKRVSFADKLREVAEAINPTIEGPYIRADLDQLGNTYVNLPLAFWLDTHGYEWTKANTDYRDFLIALGNAARDIIDPDVWVNAADLDQRCVVTDVRYPNEAQAIKDRGGYLIRVVRMEDGETLPAANDGVSEHALDDYPFDAIVFNNGAVDDLRDAVQGLAQALGWDR